MTFNEAKIVMINRGFEEVNGSHIFDGYKWRNAVAIISKWLEQQPCEDVVNRQAVLDTLDNMDKALDDDRSVESYKKLLAECYKDLPPATLKENTGKWIRGGYDDMYYVCSKCNYKASEYWHKPFYKYCPDCGIKMEAENETVSEN